MGSLFPEKFAKSQGIVHLPLKQEQIYCFQLKKNVKMSSPSLWASSPLTVGLLRAACLVAGAVPTSIHWSRAKGENLGAVL